MRLHPADLWVRLMPAKIEALIRLLGDPDEKVARTIRRHVLEFGAEAVPLLRQAGDDLDPLIRERARGLIQDVQSREVDSAFQVFVAQPPEHGEHGDALDLEDGTFLLARAEYPDLDLGAYRRQLDDMASSVGKRLGAARQGATVVRAVNDHLFIKQGFTGNTSQYYDPDNSYINRVLDRKTGIPISLSLLYLFVGARLGLPFHGVGMPGHFIVMYETPEERLFLDPFSGGHILTIEECNRFLINAGHGLKEEYLASTPAREILGRMIRNLVFIYARTADQARVKRLERFLDLLHRPHGA